MIGEDVEVPGERERDGGDADKDASNLYTVHDVKLIAIKTSN